MIDPTVTTEDLEKFTTHNRREILFYLRQLINDRERVSVVFNEGEDALLTMLLDVDETDDLLIFDWGGAESVNRKFLESDRNFFICAPHGIANRFLCGTPHRIVRNNRPAFAVALPTQYVRLQRREYFRLVLPVTRRPPCTMRREDGTAQDLAILDISIGGLAFELPGSRTDIETGQVLKGVHVELKDIGLLSAGLEVRNNTAIQRGSKVSTRIGCRFVDTDRAMEHQLQRFITSVQREERARLGG